MPTKPVHYQFADFARFTFALSGFDDEGLRLVHNLLQSADRHRTLLTGSHEAVEHLLPVESLPAAVFFYHHVGNFVDALVSGEALLALQAFAAAADGICFLALARIHDFVIFKPAKGAFHALECTRKFNLIVAGNGRRHALATKVARAILLKGSSIYGISDNPDSDRFLSAVWNGGGLDMCFSAVANFAGSGVLAGIGVVTLTRVKHRREILFASLPILFAVHQFIEGFVWLGLDGVLSPQVTHDMGAAFMLYAQGLLPFLLPLSVYLFEPTAASRRRMLPFLIIGTLTTLYILWALTAFPTEISVIGNSIVYINQATNNTYVAVLYVISTCGSLLFSKVKDMVIFGIANVVILLAVMAVKRYAFTSLWCAYAAVASIIILVYFWKSTGIRPFKYVA